MLHKYKTPIVLYTNRFYINDLILVSSINRYLIPSRTVNYNVSYVSKGVVIKTVLHHDWLLLSNET